MMGNVTRDALLASVIGMTVVLIVAAIASRLPFVPGW